MKFETKQVIDGRYEILEKLGEGGMGVVWKARHQKLGDEVAIKTPISHLCDEIIKRFGKETRTMRKFSLECPHILNIEDIGDCDGHPWYVMRYLPGGSLRDRVLSRDGNQNLQWQDALIDSMDSADSVESVGSFDWLFKIASALDFLHSQNAWHRDVKPENILFSRNGTPYLVDFGIVKNADESTSVITDPGKAIGTMSYMAPETLDSGKFSPQSDQYSLAATLYETIAGERPYLGTTFFALYKAIQNGHRQLSERHPNFPQAASDVVDRALSADPANRFATCSDFAKSFAEGLVKTQPPSESPTRMVATQNLAPDPNSNGSHAVGGKLITAPVESSFPNHASVPLKPPTKDVGYSQTGSSYGLKNVLAVVAILLVGGLLCFFGLVFTGMLKTPSQNNEKSVAELEQEIDSRSTSDNSYRQDNSDETINSSQANLIPSSIPGSETSERTIRETSYVEPEPEPKSQPRPKPQARPKPEPKPPSRKRRAPAPMPVGAEVGDQVFDLEGQTLAGFEMRISEFRGSIVLLDFWNPG